MTLCQVVVARTARSGERLDAQTRYRRSMQTGRLSSATRLVVATDEHFEWAIRAVNAERSADGLRLPEGGLEAAPVLRWIAASARAVSETTGRPAAWLIASGDHCVGVISYKRVAGEGLVEIGYGVAEARRGQGHAARAIALLLDRSLADGLALCAETSAENRASQIVLERNGFHRVGERLDPDEGSVLLWQSVA